MTVSYGYAARACMRCVLLTFWCECGCDARARACAAYLNGSILRRAAVSITCAAVQLALEAARDDDCYHRTRTRADVVEAAAGADVSAFYGARRS